MWVANKELEWVHWQQCKSEKPWALINISQGDIVDWSLLSLLKSKMQIYNMSEAVEISAFVSEPI